jgi:hypothetical protein
MSSSAKLAPFNSSSGRIRTVSEMIAVAKQPRILDPLKIFRHASAFHKSYDLLKGAVQPTDEKLVGVIAHPSMVLSVFASELYLKCLLCVENGTVPNTHDLEKLFGALPVPVRRELDDRWDADIRHPAKQKVLDQIRQKPAGKEIQLDLRYALKKGANAFQELRYFYEQERSFFMLLDFPYLLRATVLKRFPAWGSELPKPAGLVR